MIDRERAAAVMLELATAREHGAEFRQRAMKSLSHLPGYDWCGIYRLEGDNLVLDAFVGEETEHTEIPVGLGVCGTAIKENRNQVIADVRELDNYLACSVKTRSEIVVLIQSDGKVLGQIDIDGHSERAFDKNDENFLERIADLIADRW